MVIERSLVCTHRELFGGYDYDLLMLHYVGNHFDLAPQWSHTACCSFIGFHCTGQDQSPAAPSHMRPLLFNFVSDYRLFLILNPESVFMSRREREQCTADSPAAHPCLHSAGAAGGLIQEFRP